MKILDDSFREVWQASENVNVPEGTSVLKRRDRDICYSSYI